LSVCRAGSARSGSLIASRPEPAPIFFGPWRRA
jgi:hypothetical protein